MKRKNPDACKEAGTTTLQLKGPEFTQQPEWVWNESSLEPSIKNLPLILACEKDPGKPSEILTMRYRNYEIKKNACCFKEYVMVVRENTIFKTYHGPAHICDSHERGRD